MLTILVIHFAILVSIESWSIDYDNKVRLLNEHLLQFRKEVGTFDSYYQMTDLEEYPNVSDDYKSEGCANAWLREVDVIRKRNENRIVNLTYRYLSNVTKENANRKLQFEVQHSILLRKMRDTLRKFKWQHFKSPQIRRMFELETPTIESKNISVNKKLLVIGMEIQMIYIRGKPCFRRCLKEGEEEIVELFKKERNYDILEGYWSAWRDVTGRRIKPLFVERMNLQNVGAKENGYLDAAAYNLFGDFEESNFNDTAYRLYNEIEPLYKELHGFVRYCLWKYYPGRFTKAGPIPAHTLGNLWAEQWNNIMPILQDCAGIVSTYDIQQEVDKNLRNISVRKMFETAEEFYTSIGMSAMTNTFWNRSVIEMQPDRLMDCHGLSEDFSNGVDFRTLMCTKRDIIDFNTIHHEMGHIEYFMAYRHLPYVLQDAANPAFEEAIGDTIALSAKTPEHLQKLGLINDVIDSKSFDLNYLLSIALEKVVFLPYALTMDSYLWAVYNGSVPYSRLNQFWWDLQYRLQGIKPPNQRSEAHFDAAAKYHMAFGVNYIRYFVGFILEFQFYEVMCNLSGYLGPLHRCDFYKSKTAGKKMLEMLSKGKSQHWRDSLKILTGDRDIKSSSLMKYFDPLYKWLKFINSKLQIPIGW